MKTLDIIRKATPEQSGYLDSLALIENGEEIWSGPGASYPNPFQPATKKPWVDCYALIKEAEYDAKCVITPRFFKCLQLEGGMLIPTINPNINHKGLYVANGIFVHCGDTEIWRGSAGCITIAPSLWDDFIGKFDLDEDVKIKLRKVGIA